MFEKLKARALAAMGSEKALGRFEFLTVVEKIKGDWERHSGRTGASPTAGNVVRFLHVEYGAILDIDHLNIDQDATFNREQLDRFLEGVAGQLIESGSVEVSY